MVIHIGQIFCSSETSMHIRVLYQVYQRYACQALLIDDA